MTVLVRLLGSGHEALAVENAALRLQLLAYLMLRIGHVAELFVEQEPAVPVLRLPPHPAAQPQ